jgi:hypothetical protein
MTLTSLEVRMAPLRRQTMRPAALAWDQWYVLCSAGYNKQIEELAVLKPHRVFQWELRGLQWGPIQHLLTLEVENVRGSIHF